MWLLIAIASFVGECAFQIRQFVGELMTGG